MKINKAKISYEPEADVLMWKIAEKPIDYANEIGNIVVHFTKNNVPVLIEILEASKFLESSKNIVEKESKVFVHRHALATR
ncbi:MAG TPA: DUF2283 domain-containing protein [Candidatus Paceibacterota bacterium]